MKTVNWTKKLSASLLLWSFLLTASMAMVTTTSHASAVGVIVGAGAAIQYASTIGYAMLTKDKKPIRKVSNCAAPMKTSQTATPTATPSKAKKTALAKAAPAYIPPKPRTPAIRARQLHYNVLEPVHTTYQTPPLFTLYR